MGNWYNKYLGKVFYIGKEILKDDYGNYIFTKIIKDGVGGNLYIFEYDGKPKVVLGYKAIKEIFKANDIQEY